MISLLPRRISHGGRATRRDLLRIGALGSLGLALPGRIATALSPDAPNGHRATAKRCIYIFLCGGPSQLDMWDPKPDAPDGIRGPFKSIATKVPGIRFGELLPGVAGCADKLAVIRSMHHDTNAHDVGILYTLGGTMRPATRRASPPERTDFPAAGAVLQSLLGGAGNLPAWVTVPRPFTTGARLFKGQSGGFLGAAYDPFLLDEPKRDSLGNRDIEVGSLQLPEGLDEARFEARQELLAKLDASGSQVPAAAVGQLRDYYDKAFYMLSSDGAKAAFNLEAEPARLRERYGLNEYGQSFLLARRLVEHGVRTVNVFWTYYGPDGCQFNLWDNHGSDQKVCGGANSGIDMLKHDYCCPSFDRAFPALLNDLDARGLLDETLVVVVGEFGRTPKINQFAGRDHWGSCYSAVLAGGGIHGGQVYGASDKQAAFVQHSPVTPDDLTATIYHAFGFEPETAIHDPANRPVPISQGTPIRALF